MTDEEYVRGAWVDVEYGSKSRTGKPVRISHRGRQYYALISWSAAAEFTRNRLEQIAEVEEEIETLKSLSMPLSKIPALLRTGKRAEAALAELKKGMRP